MEFACRKFLQIHVSRQPAPQKKMKNIHIHPSKRPQNKPRKVMCDKTERCDKRDKDVNLAGQFFNEVGVKCNKRKKGRKFAGFLNAVRLTFLGWRTRSAISSSPGCGRTRPCTNHFMRFAPSWFPTTKNTLNNSAHSTCLLPLLFFSHHALPAVIAFLHWRVPHIQKPAKGQKGCTTSS